MWMQGLEESGALGVVFRGWVEASSALHFVNASDFQRLAFARFLATAFYFSLCNNW